MGVARSTSGERPRRTYVTVTREPKGLEANQSQSDGRLHRGPSPSGTRPTNPRPAPRRHDLPSGVGSDARRRVDAEHRRSASPSHGGHPSYEGSDAQRRADVQYLFNAKALSGTTLSSEDEGIEHTSRGISREPSSALMA